MRKTKEDAYEMLYFLYLLICLTIEALWYAFYATTGFVVSITLSTCYYCFVSYPLYIFAYYCLTMSISFVVLISQFTMTNVDCDIDAEYARQKERYLQSLKPGFHKFGIQTMLSPSAPKRDD